MVLICSFSYLEYFPTAVSLLASGVSLMNDQRIGTQSVVRVLCEHRENILTCHNMPKPNDRPPLLSRHSTCQVIVVWRTSYEYGLGSRKEGPCILRLTSFLTHFYLLHEHTGNGCVWSRWKGTRGPLGPRSTPRVSKMFFLLPIHPDTIASALLTEDNS